MSKKKYNPERAVWRGKSYKKGTTGHDGTRVRDLRDKSATKAERKSTPKAKEI